MRQLRAAGVPVVACSVLVPLVAGAVAAALLNTRGGSQSQALAVFETLTAVAVVSLVATCLRQPLGELACVMVRPVSTLTLFSAGIVLALAAGVQGLTSLLVSNRSPLGGWRALICLMGAALVIAALAGEDRAWIGPLLLGLPMVFFGLRLRAAQSWAWLLAPPADTRSLAASTAVFLAGLVLYRLRPGRLISD